MISTVISLLFFLSISSTGAGYSGNYALSFDGVSSIVKIGHVYTDLFLSDDWTLEAWIKPYGNQITSFQPNIVGFPQRHPNLELCGSTCAPDGPTKTLAQLRDRNGNYFINTGNVIITDTTNTWYHIAATWNNVSFTTYVNGQQDVTMQPYTKGYIEPLNCSFVLCDEGIDIGGYRFIIPNTGSIFSAQYFKGLIDEVRVWNIGRTQTEISNNMNQVLTGNEQGLVYYWRFDEGSGTLVNSLALDAYGTLGGGIIAAEPRWVQSDSPLSNPYPQTPSGPVGVTSCNCNEAGVYVAGSILSILFIIVGMIFGILGYKKFGGGYQNLK